jgi:hypothetical protein
MLTTAGRRGSCAPRDSVCDAPVDNPAERGCVRACAAVAAGTRCRQWSRCGRCQVPRSCTALAAHSGRRRRGLNSTLAPRSIGSTSPAGHVMVRSRKLILKSAFENRSPLRGTQGFQMTSYLARQAHDLALRTRDAYGLPFKGELEFGGAAALQVSRTQSLRRCERERAAPSQAARSSSVTRIVIDLLAAPLDERGAGPRPPPGHPLPRASAGSTSSSWRFPPVYGVRCAQPPRSAGQYTRPPSLSSPIQWLGIWRERKSFICVANPKLARHLGQIKRSTC